MINRVGIVSLKFSPGLLKEFLAHREKFKSQGISVRLFVDHRYCALNNKISGLKEFSDNYFLMLMQVIINLIKPNKVITDYIRDIDALFIYNFHPINIVLCRLAKRSHKKVFLYIHEPYMPDKMMYGFKAAIRIKILEEFQIYNVSFANHVFLPSENAIRHFDVRTRSRFLNRSISHLLLQDKFAEHNVSNSTKTIVFVGKIHKTKRFNEFLGLAEMSKKEEYKFIIITTSSLSPRQNRQIELADNVELINDVFINDNVIEEAIYKASALFKADKAMTQSGLVAQSMMLGTPVICSFIPGFTQHIIEGSNGFILDFNKGTWKRELLNAIDMVDLHRDKFRSNCRSSYKQYWDGSNWQKEIGVYFK